MTEGVLAMLGAKGFRPFFLLAGVFSTVVVPLWLAVWTGRVALAGPLTGVVWHAHEMIFGFTLAVVAGFLLTAAENWTGHATLRGGPLLAAAGIWLAARVAILLPGWTGAALDLAVIPLVGFGLARALYADGNRRNAPFVALLAALWLADVLVWLDAAGVVEGVAVRAHRSAVWVIAVIIGIVAGRVVPMFTRNATGDSTVATWPLVDRVAIGATVAVAALQIAAVDAVLPWVALVAGGAALVRMVPWWTRGVLSRPLLWILHLGHGAVAVGLLLEGLRAWLPLPGSAALHALTVGGIGLLTIGMMARVSLGHTGRPIVAGRTVTVGFVCVAAALVLRVVGPALDPLRLNDWLFAAAIAWSAGFGLFAARYAPILLAPRVDGKPG